ncbi:potassium-transporting ATPase subunit KdpA [Morganella morganii subsp. sibonii]
MAANAFLLIAGFLIVLLIAAKLLSNLLVCFIDGTPLPVLRRAEGVLWRFAGIGRDEMRWQGYLTSLLLFNALGLIFLTAILMLQADLPLNPRHFPGMSWDLALNTAVSFVTNTNWQSYSGESSVSYFSQMAGLTVQNFLSAATGIAVAFALIRALCRRSVKTLGNAWVDLTRITLWLLLPLSVIIALFFISQGVIQNFHDYQTIITPEGVQQVLPMGPVASQEAIKLLGTNGGGFFGANSAHPFENPTALTNFVQMLAIFLIPASLCFAFGRCAGNPGQGRALLAAMTIVFVAAAAAVMWSETHGNPAFAGMGIDSTFNMEGKESRFGILATGLFVAVTTAASCGAVNSMHDSLTPLGGLVPLWLMQIGEVIFGGVGAGFYGMMLFVFLAVFIAGLMIGRTPEYLSKKIEVREMKLTALAILVTPALVLGGTALAMMTEAGRSAMLNPGAHGFSEVLYALSSASNNNGSAFAGLSTNTPFWNLLLAFCMLAGRFVVIALVMMLAGSLVSKTIRTAGAGTLPTTGPLFTGLLIAAVLLIGALTFVPALALGPVAEFLDLLK